MAERKTWEAEDRSRRNTHFKGMATVIHFPLQASCPSFPSSHIPLNCDSANGSKHWFGQRPHDLIIPHMPPLWTLNRRPNFQPMSLLRIIYSQATTMDNNHFYCYNFIIYFLFLCNWKLKHTSFYHLYKFQCSTLKEPSLSVIHSPLSFVVLVRQTLRIIRPHKKSDPSITHSSIHSLNWWLWTEQLFLTWNITK
jgi:hypothetical protein